MSKHFKPHYYSDEKGDWIPEDIVTPVGKYSVKIGPTETICDTFEGAKDVVHVYCIENGCEARFFMGESRGMKFQYLKGEIVDKRSGWSQKPVSIRYFGNVYNDDNGGLE